MQPKRKLKAISGIRDFSVCQIERLLLVVSYDIIKMYDMDIQSPVYSIKLDSSPRIVKLSPNGRYFITYENNNMMNIYESRSGTIVQSIHQVPSSIKTIRFSKNSKKLLYASTQIISLWNIENCALQLRTQNWKNINCYDINAEGNQFAIGTYNGDIYIITYISQGKCSQIKISKHRNCVVVLCLHGDKMISVSYEGHLLISTLSVSENGDRLVSYNSLRLSSIPRQIQSVGDTFYMFDPHGITWFTNNNVLVGFADSKAYKPFINEDGELIFVKIYGTDVQWWEGKILKQSFNRNSLK